MKLENPPLEKEIPFVNICEPSFSGSMFNVGGVIYKTPEPNSSVSNVCKSQEIVPFFPQ